MILSGGSSNRPLATAAPIFVGSTRASTRKYDAFLNELRLALLSGGVEELAPLLDGRAGSRCLDLVRPASVRRLGAFFTPSGAALKLVDQLSIRRWADTLIF